MAPKETRRCCTWTRCSLLLLVVAGVFALVYFVTPLGDEVQDLFSDDEVGNDTDVSNPNPEASPTAAPSPSSYDFFQCDRANTNLDGCCNGIDGLCDLRIDEVLWPIAHNAMATLRDGFPLFPNHLYPLEEALDAGYRGINLDVCICGGRYVLCHGQCSLGTRDPLVVFANIISFLGDNPTESIVVNLELNSDADGPVVLGDFAALLLQEVPGLRQFLHVQADIAQPWPTLGDLKASGQTLVVFHHRGPTCTIENACPEGFHFWFASVVETPFQFRSEQDLLDSAASCAIDRGAAGTRSFFALNTFTTLPDIREARIVNRRAFLETHMDACSMLNGGLDVNFLYVDFWHEGDVLETIQEHNRLLARRRQLLWWRRRRPSPYNFFQCDEMSLGGCCNGLDGLCDLRINDILWPMSHNANAAQQTGYRFLPSHVHSLEESLEAGYRGINLDVCKCGGEYTLCHAQCFFGKRDPVSVFSNIVAFLDRNPTESVLLNLELATDPGDDVVLDEFASLILYGVPGLQEYLYVQSDVSQAWPTLGELKVSNKRLVLFHHRGPECLNAGECPDGFHYWFGSVVETPFSFKNEDSLLDTEQSCSLDRGASGTRAFFAVNAFTTPPERREARVVNKRDFLEDRIQTCSSLNGNLDVNIVSVDFWRDGAVLETVQEYNRQLIDARRLGGQYRALRHQSSQG